MFDKHFMKGFFDFLSTASVQELNDRLEKVRELKHTFLVCTDVHADASFLERKLQEEVLTRVTLAELHRRPAAA